MGEITFEENVISIREKEIQLDHEIRTVVKKDGVIIVLFAPASNDPRNVIALDEDGNKLWEIEPVRTHSGDEYSPYTGLIIEEGSIVGSNWNSKDYKIDRGTGNVTRLRTFK